MSMSGDNHFRRPSDKERFVFEPVELKGLNAQEKLDIRGNLDPRIFKFGASKIDTLKRNVIIILTSYQEVKEVNSYFKREDFHVYYAKVNDEDSFAHLLKYFTRDDELLIYLSHSTTHVGLDKPDKFNPDSVMIVNDNLDYHEGKIDRKKCYTFKDAVFGEKLESVSDKTLRQIKEVAKNDGIRYMQLVQDNSASIDPETFKEINQDFVDAVG